jgi:hypothetical protein
MEWILLNFIKNIFLIRWLWLLFGGFYLVAYVFWIPNLLEELIIIILFSGITLIIGIGFLLEGFWRILELEGKNTMPVLPQKKIWQILGGILLIGFIVVYIPADGRIVAHWPLDLAITVLAGVMMFFFTIKNE